MPERPVDGRTASHDLRGAACRWIERNRKRILETWSHVLRLGQPLPTLPLWLAENFSYEETCGVLRIP